MRLQSWMAAAGIAAMTSGWSAPLSAEGAGGYRVMAKQGAFEAVAEDVREAIIKRGYVIDYTGQLNAMLVRTAIDTGTVTGSGKESPYRNAIFVQFCPARLTHEAVNASPLAIANCPVAIHVFETTAEPGKVQVGYRLPEVSPSKLVTRVNAKLADVLAEIVAEATR